ncbi:hypothetical protein HNQ92_001056 [Rhabdobacter roseus]|uniref:Uncharacterized protein n=1 Tax=Rhabdobacter roseus TaxID=1655419 RepID=A0A840TSF2_9BACT|nr:hypothetical protein [Rhabdobacter roseus]
MSEYKSFNSKSFTSCKQLKQLNQVQSQTRKTGHLTSEDVLLQKLDLNTQI